MRRSLATFLAAVFLHMALPVGALSFSSNLDQKLATEAPSCHQGQKPLETSQSPDKEESPCRHCDECQSASLCCLLMVFVPQQDAKLLYSSHPLQSFHLSLQGLEAILPLEKPPKVSLLS